MSSAQSLPPTAEEFLQQHPAPPPAAKKGRHKTLLVIQRAPAKVIAWWRKRPGAARPEEEAGQRREGPRRERPVSRVGLLRNPATDLTLRKMFALDELYTLFHPPELPAEARLAALPGRSVAPRRARLASSQASTSSASSGLARSLSTSTAASSPPSSAPSSAPVESAVGAGARPSNAPRAAAAELPAAAAKRPLAERRAPLAPLALPPATRAPAPSKAPEPSPPEFAARPYTLPPLGLLPPLLGEPAPQASPWIAGLEAIEEEESLFDVSPLPSPALEDWPLPPGASWLAPATEAGHCAPKQPSSPEWFALPPPTPPPSEPLPPLPSLPLSRQALPAWRHVQLAEAPLVSLPRPMARRLLGLLGEPLSCAPHDVVGMSLHFTLSDLEWIGDWLQDGTVSAWDARALATIRQRPWYAPSAASPRAPELQCFRLDLLLQLTEAMLERASELSAAARRRYDEETALLARLGVPWLEAALEAPAEPGATRLRLPQQSDLLAESHALERQALWLARAHACERQRLALLNDVRQVQAAAAQAELPRGGRRPGRHAPPLAAPTALG